MRVLIHAPAARMGGARSHLLGLVPELAAAHPESSFLLLAQPDLLEVLPPLPANWEPRAERAQERGFLRRLAWEQAALPAIAGQWRADVLLSFGSFVPLRAPCPRVLEAGNALPFTRAYWLLARRERARFQAEEVARWLLLQASLRASARVLVPSRSMRQDVVSRVPELADRVDVALWGVAEVFHQARWAPVRANVLLGVSKHGINKEFDVLVVAVGRLVDRWPDLRLELTGTPEESRWSRESARLAEELGLLSRLRWLGDLPNDAVPASIRRARTLVFPTWCESFGLPLAEALAMGAPALAGDIPACREVGGDAARYYHPGSVDSMAEQLATLLEDEPAAAALSERARARGATFRWRANAEAVWASLEKAVEGVP